jgi:nucleoside-diphosphate-sugar epimerase
MASPKPRIVLTGAAGFIGSYLGPRLSDLGHEVLAVDHMLNGYEHNLAWARTPLPCGGTRPVTIVRACAGSSEVAALLHPGDILGANSSLASNQVDPRASYASTAGLLEASRLAGVAHFVFASTSAIYENTLTTPTREGDVVAPNLVYSLGKKHCEDLVRAFRDVYGLPFTILRFFNVFGPHMDGARAQPPLIPYLIDNFAKGVPPILHSDGTQARDYIYVSDLLRLVELLVKAGPLNEAINLASGVTVTVRDIVAAVQRAMAVSVEPVYRAPALLWEGTPGLWAGVRPFPRERMAEEVCKYTLGDPTRAAELLGWRAEVGLEEGIRDILGKSGLLGAP